MLLSAIKTLFHKELEAFYPKEEIDSFFYLMMEFYLKLERFVLVLQPNYILTKEEEAPFFKGLSRLRNQEPIQYILGETEFMGMPFKVTPDVLIPRPETEELVQWILDTYKDSTQPLSILDVGTGSGCIAIALAKQMKNVKVTALDISKKALQVAQQNAHLNEVAVEFLETDINQTDLVAKFDIIVSNPPYVRPLEKQEMNENVLRFEPSLALFVTDHDPLVFYKVLVAFSKTNLIPGGAIFLEINQYLSRETQQLLVDNEMQEVELRKDIFGNFRMLKGIRP